MMEKKGLISTFVYILTAIIFSLSASITVFLGSLGWLLSEWDPLELSNSTNNIGLCIMPVIFCLSFTITFYTIHILITHNISNSKNVFMGYLVMSTGIGIFVLNTSAIGITLSYSKNDSIVPSFTEDIFTTLSFIHWVAMYLGLFVLFLSFSLYLAWHESFPKNKTELEGWREYINQTSIPWSKWIGFFGALIVLIVFVLPPILIFLNVLKTTENLLILQGLIIFFPGPFVFFIFFIIVNWRVVKLRLDLFRLDYKSKQKIQKIEKLNNSNETQSSKRKLRWKDFLVLGTLELGFIIIFAILLINYWIEVIILSLWALIFLSVLILLPHV